MTTTPFQPVGDRARWQMVSDLIESTPTDAVIRYEDAARELDMHPVRDRAVIQQAIRTAARHHQEDTGRAIESVPNVGYRVVKSTENLRLAHGQQKRSRRALRKAHQTLVLTDRKGMSLEERRRFEVSESAAGLLLDYARRLDFRTSRLEKAMTAVTQQTILNRDETERTADEVAELKGRLEKIERRHSTGPDAA